MYLGHNIPLPHPSSTMSYDTQPVMHHVSAFQHRAGLLAELVHPLRNVFVQVCCTLPCPLLGIIIDCPRGFEEKQFFKAGQRPSKVLWKPILLHEIKVSTARDNNLDVGFSWRYPPLNLTYSMTISIAVNGSEA